jgi:hypothetical protein
MRCFTAILVCLLFVVGAGASAAAPLSDFTCDDFSTQRAAQAALSPLNEEALDPDGDGIACEDLSDTPGQSSSRESQDRDRDEDEDDDGDITRQERQYIDDLNDGLIELGEASTEVGEQFTEASKDPSLFLDEEWTLQTAAQFVRIQQVAEDARALDPSDRQGHIQELWLAVNDLAETAVDEYIVGIDSLAPESLEMGAARYVYAGLLVGDLIAARDAFNEDPNDPVEPEHVIGPVEECNEFDDYDVAQDYYAAHPEEQETIDPDFDGLACEAAGSDPTGAPRAKVNPASGGLGLTGSEWKAAYGNPIETEFSANVTSFAGAGGRVDHQGFSDDGQSIQFTINFEEPVALDVAQSVAEKYFPADTKLIREYSRPSLIQNVALYHSTWLGENMSGPWLDAEPGSFLAIYHWEGESASTRIGSVLIGVSHNP